jgi:hypothetical protein
VDGFGYSQPIVEGINVYTLGSFISSVAPSLGPIGGGTLISIVGTNFLPGVHTNQVFIGDQKC